MHAEHADNVGQGRKCGELYTWPVSLFPRVWQCRDLMKSTARPSFFQPSASWNISVLLSITAEWHSSQEEFDQRGVRTPCLGLAWWVWCFHQSNRKASFVNKYANVFMYLAGPTPSRLICAESEPCPFASPSSLRPYDRPTRISFVLLPSNSWRNKRKWFRPCHS
jgi:hypothetical protein